MSNFAELLKMTREQQDAQRLLFLFASTDISRQSTPQGASSPDNHGTVEPRMCVDKLPADLESWPALLTEADSVNKDWDLVFICGLSGEGEKAPSEEEAEPYLNKMTNDIKSGQDLSRYLVLDRQENAIVINAS